MKSTLVQMPDGLLHHRLLGKSAKLLWLIHALGASTAPASPAPGPPPSRARDQFTYAQLSNLIGLGANTVKRAARALQEIGWLAISQQNKFSPIHFVLEIGIRHLSAGPGPANRPNHALVIIAHCHRLPDGDCSPLRGPVARHYQGGAVASRSPAPPVIRHAPAERRT